jgi:uncharacterized protein (DUF58 family)
VLQSLKKIFNNWLFRPQISSGTITLNQRRIFILPTRRGLGFACVLLVMLLGDINYNLSLGYVLTFLLGTTAAMTMLHAFRNMAQLEIHAGHNEATFAGNNACFVFHFHNTSKLPRYQLKLSDRNAHATLFDIMALQQRKVELLIPADRRGWLDCGRLTLSTEFPLGLFYAWSYLHFETRSLIYPKPAPSTSLPANTAQDGIGKLTAAGDEDFAGLRNYVAGDALPRIAWKTLARGLDLQVKQFNAQQGNELWLDENLLPDLTLEQKLEMLTRWLLDADAQGLRYGLRLHGVEILPQQGSAHLTECLSTLALYQLEPR